MRWFKHLTDASDDAFIHSIEARFGLEGYARWWKLCEKIGKQLKPADTSASLTLPWNVWESYLKAKRKQLRSFLEAIEKEGRIIINDSGNVLRIELPKLLKFRDEYLRKSGQPSGRTPDRSPDKLPAKIQSTDTENRSKKKKPSSASRKTKLTEEWKPKDSTRRWSAEKFPRLSFDAEFENFRDWHLGKGDVWSDWDRSLMTWIRKAAERRPSQPALGAARTLFTPGHDNKPE